MAARRALILTRTKNMVGAFHMPKLVFTNINTASDASGRQDFAVMGRLSAIDQGMRHIMRLLENGRFILARKPEALRKTVTPRTAGSSVLC